MEWFRFYHGAVDDPKVQRLAPVLFKHWVNLLCLASQQEPRGTLPPASDIAFRLRLTEAKADEALAELVAIGLVDRDAAGAHAIHNWHGRQRASDDVAQRQRKHRGNVTGNGPGNGPSNETVTLHGTPKSLSRATEQIQRQKQRQNRDASSSSASPSRVTRANGAAVTTDDDDEADSLFSLFCDVTKGDAATVPAATKRSQHGVFVGLLADHSAADVAGCMRWLASWRDVPWTPETVAKDIDTWILEQRPTHGKRKPTSRGQLPPRGGDSGDQNGDQHGGPPKERAPAKMLYQTFDLDKNDYVDLPEPIPDTDPRYAVEHAASRERVRQAGQRDRENA